MKVIYARHGESTANTLHVFSNRQADHPLTEKGKEQAATLGNELSSVTITDFYSSPIPRAVQTAQIISDFLHIPFKVDDGLREFDAGVLEGRSDEAAWAEFSDLWNAWFTLELPHHKLDGGESLVEIQARLEKFLNNLVDRFRNHETTILCITHGGLLYAGLPGLVENITYAFVRDNPLANAACVVIIRNGDHWICEQWGEKLLKG